MDATTTVAREFHSTESDRSDFKNA